jgi:NADPH:quinone reductase-like Zn-dependent oxidoreductase
MRAAGVRALGEPVEILGVDEPAAPGRDEVLIDVAAAGVGNWDELVRIGSWQIGGPAPMALRRPERSQPSGPTWPTCAKATR